MCVQLSRKRGHAEEQPEDARDEREGLYGKILLDGVEPRAGFLDVPTVLLQRLEESRDVLACDPRATEGSVAKIGGSQR
nr:hypothetical protein pRERM10c [Prescottella equi]